MPLADLLYRRTIINYLLLPLALSFSLLLKLRRRFLRNRPGYAYQSQTIVISVGNILLGGSGKTPFTIFLAGLIQKLGYKVAVSHRGYKGEYENNVVLISDREKVFPQADTAGDEPLLLASKLPGIPVVVGKNRKKSVALLEKRYPDLDFVILDDSFQHLKVRHHYDFVLFKTNGSDSAARNRFVFPAGPFREPLSSLKDADAIVTISSSPQELQQDGKASPAIPEKLLQHCLPAAKHLSGAFQVTGYTDTDGNSISPETLASSKLALISALGQPASFERTILSQGLSFGKHYIFPDHYHFSSLQSVEEAAKGWTKNNTGNIYDYLLTTEKDFTKLKRFYLCLPLVVVSVAFIPAAAAPFTRIIKTLADNKTNEHHKPASPLG